MKKVALVLLLTVACLASGCYDSNRPALSSLNQKTILVTGVTGTQGGSVARELLDRGYTVRGLTRNPDSRRAQAMTALGVEVVKGDFDDAASLAAAMHEVYGVFAVTNFWEHGYQKEVAHGRQLIRAAEGANVSHFVFTSVAGADAGTDVPHFDSKREIEASLRASGINYSIVRPVEFMDNIKYDREQIISRGFMDPRDESKLHQWIAADDIGFFVGEAFDHPEEWIGKALDIAGDEMTLAEYAAILSVIFNRDVVQRKITWSEYEEQVGEELTLMMRWFDEKGYDVDVEALRQRYPNLLTFEQYLLSLGWN